MSTTNPLDILKSALLLEIRGQAFYKKAAQQAENQAVKDFFETMAAEEVHHIEILSDQYKAVKAKGQFTAPNIEGTPTGVAENVLAESLKKRISAAGFESAAISAAMGMEERAIKLYAQRADDGPRPSHRQVIASSPTKGALLLDHRLFTPSGPLYARWAVLRPMGRFTPSGPLYAPWASLRPVGLFTPGGPLYAQRA